MATSSPQKEFEDDWLLRCTNCVQLLDDEDNYPRLLTCLHTVCYSCLKTLIHEDTLTCPNCSERHENVGIDSFPRDNTRLGLLKYTTLRQKASIECSACDETSPAVTHCVDCGDFLCGPCRDAHRKVKFTRNHELTDIENLVEGNKSAYFHKKDVCEEPDHFGSRLDYFCESPSCQSFICKLCFQIDHKDHTVKPLEVIAEEQISILQNILKQAQQKQKVLERSHQSVSSTIKAVHDSEARTSREIDKSFTECQTRLKIRHEEIKKELRTASSNKLHFLEEKLESIKVNERSSKYACEFAEKLILRLANVSSFEVCKIVHERLNQFVCNRETVPTDASAYINFEPLGMGKDFMQMTSKMGKLSVSKVSPQNTKIKTHDAMLGEESVIAHIHLCDYDGAPVIDPYVNIKAKIKVENNQSNQAISVEFDEEEGAFEVKCRPATTQRHEMEVWVRDHQVSGIFSFDVMCDASTEDLYLDLDSYEEVWESYIFVHGIHDAVSESDIKSYFRDAQQSGGGPLREVHFDRLSQSAVIHFTNKADARKVQSQQHNLRGRTLKVMAYDQNLKCPVYSDRFLFGAKHPSTSGEDLCSFLEKLVGIDTVECLFGEDPEKAVVTFRTPPEVDRLRAGCGESKLHDRYLEIKRVPVSSCIMVESANANTTKEFIKGHFENSMNGGGVINNITEKKGGDYVLIYFKDFETAVSVQARNHRLNGKDMNVSVYYESLGRAQKQATFTLPQPIVIDPSYKDILDFIQSSKPEMSSLENQMKECKATVKWPCKKLSTVALECGLSPKIKDYRKHAFNWPVEVQKKFGDTTKRISKIEFYVSPGLIGDLLQELSTANVSNPDRVVVLPMKSQNVIKVVGYKEDVTEVQRVIQETMSKAEREHTIVTWAESMKPHILQLLLVSNWITTVEAKHKQIKVACDTQKKQVCLHGMKKLVEEARQELLKFVKGVQSRVVNDIDECCLPLYSNQEVKDYISQKLKTAGLPVVYELSKKIDVYGTDEKVLSDGIEIIKGSVMVTITKLVFPCSQKIDNLKYRHKGRLLVTVNKRLWGFFLYCIVSTDDIHKKVVHVISENTCM